VAVEMANLLWALDEGGVAAADDLDEDDDETDAPGDVAEAGR
jgi:hypothetical protein